MLLLLATSALAAAAPAAATQHVYIIRHGEKEGADGHLSPAGVARSHALPNIFNAQPSSHHATFGKPTALFAHYYTKSSGQSERCVATLAPIAAADDLRTNSSFGSDPSLGGNGAAAYAIKAALARGHHTVLVAWEHVNIAPLTALLGVDSEQIPSWSGEDFDTCYVLSFSAGVPSKLQSFAVSAENITAPDGGRTNSNSAAGDVAPAAAAASPPPPLKGCLFPHHTQPFCDESKSAAQRAALLANLLTVPELISAMQGDTPAIKRLGIPLYHYGYEALHGMIQNCPFPDRCFTSFPCSSASAASFNRSLWHAVGSAQIDETNGNQGVIKGMHVRGPQLNPQRDPRWGRNDNSPGEDAYLEGQYGAQIVLGGQGADADGTYPLGDKRKAICEMKHFDAYSVESDRDQATNTFEISLKDLVEYYFVPLKSCIQNADVGAFMCSYDAINGTAACADQWLNQDVVRKTWNFTGVIETDCGALSGIQTHGNAKSQAGAAVAGLNYGTVDVECDAAYKNNLLKVTQEGRVKKKSLVAAVTRIFKGRFQVGQFDREETPWDKLASETEVFSKEHQQVSLEGAQQSLVLLRNPGGLLPLAKGKKIAIVGPNGGVKDVFQGQYHGGNCPADASHTYNYSCLDSAFTAIQRANGAPDLTTFVAGCNDTKVNKDVNPDGPTWAPQLCPFLRDKDVVTANVKEADVVLLVLGLDIKVTNKEGQDRVNTNSSGKVGNYPLPGAQQDLARAVAAMGKPVVVIIYSGMAVGMDYIASMTKSPLIIGGYGGRFAPTALQQALFGEISPSGKLPYTIYPEAWAEATPFRDFALTAGDGRTYKYLKTAAPFMFGEGVSYSTFTVKVDAVISLGAKFSVTVTNTGKVVASEAVLLYSRAEAVPTAPKPLPNRQLFDFGRTPVLAPGASHTLSFVIKAEGVSLVDWAGTRAAHAGDYAIEFSNGGKAPAATRKLTVQDAVVLSAIPPPHKNPTIPK